MEHMLLVSVLHHTVGLEVLCFAVRLLNKNINTL